MIKEMGIQKMNMLLSKKEDLMDLIDKGYEVSLYIYIKISYYR